MTTYLLTWNSERWDFPEGEFEARVARTAAGELVADSWSTGGRTKDIGRDDRCFLVRQGTERGIVASGYYTSEIEQRPSFDGSGDDANYADLAWDAFLGLADRLPVQELKAHVPGVAWDRLQGSGVRVPDDAADDLERLWRDHLRDLEFVTADEVAVEDGYPEGAASRVLVNRYERDRNARRACLAHHGTRCAVCDLDFRERYGKLGVDYIHVHHLEELSTVGNDYRVDPIKDLRPVCPNCHAMLHRERPALTIANLKRRLRA